MQYKLLPVVVLGFVAVFASGAEAQCNYPPPPPPPAPSATNISAPNSPSYSPASTRGLAYTPINNTPGPGQGSVADHGPGIAAALAVTAIEDASKQRGEREAAFRAYNAVYNTINDDIEASLKRNGCSAKDLTRLDFQLNRAKSDYESTKMAYQESLDRPWIGGMSLQDLDAAKKVAEQKLIAAQNAYDSAYEMNRKITYDVQKKYTDDYRAAHERLQKADATLDSANNAALTVINSFLGK